jgi:hypothetical protein
MGYFLPMEGGGSWYRSLKALREEENVTSSWGVGYNVDDVWWAKAIMQSNGSELIRSMGVQRGGRGLVSCGTAGSDEPHL